MSRLKEWESYNPFYIKNPYNYIAPVYPVFEWIFMLPNGIRRKAVNALNIKNGDNVLEIGCGTGKNLPLLSKAAGAEGTVFGIDVSDGMLRRAGTLKQRRNLSNVELICTDAAKFIPSKKINSVLFSLSYATMIHRKDVLKKLWDLLEPGGRVVIMDAQFPAGTAGKIMAPVKPLITLLLKASVLGNPYIKPVEELTEITGTTPVVTEFSMKSYFIAAAVKN
jgi:demethylmenaquinone methyltransferase/2-methoxy-6-polyprenyl-1,4-benzoquinol methylase